MRHHGNTSCAAHFGAGEVQPIERAHKAQLLMSRLCRGNSCIQIRRMRERVSVCDRMQRFIMEEIHVCSVSMTPALSGYEMLLNTKEQAPY